MPTGREDPHKLRGYMKTSVGTFSWQPGDRSAVFLLVASPLRNTVENRTSSTHCSVMLVLPWPAGGSFQYLSLSFRGNNSSLSISSISAMVFACFQVMSVSAATVAPSRGLVNFAAPQTSPSLRFLQIVTIHSALGQSN